MRAGLGGGLTGSRTGRCLCVSREAWVVLERFHKRYLGRFLLVVSGGWIKWLPGPGSAFLRHERLGPIATMVARIAGLTEPPRLPSLTKLRKLARG